MREQVREFLIAHGIKFKEGAHEWRGQLEITFIIDDANADQKFMDELENAFEWLDITDEYDNNVYWVNYCYEVYDEWTLEVQVLW